MGRNQSLNSLTGATLKGIRILFIINARIPKPVLRAEAPLSVTKEREVSVGSANGELMNKNGRELVAVCEALDTCGGADFRKKE